MDSNRGEVMAVCISRAKGIGKDPVPSARLIAGHGFEADAHAGAWHRQVSLLAEESIETMRRRGADVGHGAFGENIVTRGIELRTLKVGDRLRLGGSAELEVTQRGKECHDHCAIYQKVGDCVMPRDGVFTRVINGGTVSPNDPIELVGQPAEEAEQ